MPSHHYTARSTHHHDLKGTQLFGPPEVSVKFVEILDNQLKAGNLTSRHINRLCNVFDEAYVEMKALLGVKDPKVARRLYWRWRADLLVRTVERVALMPTTVQTHTMWALKAVLRSHENHHRYYTPLKNLTPRTPITGTP